MVQTGEKYAYSDYICSKVVYPKGTKFIYQDVSCKFWGWRKSAQVKVSSSTVQHEGAAAARELLQQEPSGPHVLADMHGRGHGLFCQASVSGSADPWFLHTPPPPSPCLCMSVSTICSAGQSHTLEAC